MQDKYSILEAWARSRWSNAGERVFQWSREVCSPVQPKHAASCATRIASHGRQPGRLLMEELPSKAVAHSAVIKLLCEAQDLMAAHRSAPIHVLDHHLYNRPCTPVLSTGRQG